MKHLARLLLLLLLVSPAFGARTFNNTSSDNLNLTSAPVTAAPLTISAWSVPTNASDPDVLVTLGRSGVNVDRFSLETNGGHCAINVRDAAGANNRQSSNTTYTSGTQVNCIGVSASTSSRTVWLNGGGKSNATNTITQPVGVNSLHVSGDQSGGANFFTGRLSHVAIWNIAFTDTQAAYIGAGGNPRYIPGLIAYYKLIPGTSPEPDELAGTGLTVTGTGTNTGDPVVGTFWTAASIPNQSWTQNAPIAPITADSNFSNTNSACTTSWKLLGSPSNDTTASGAGTASREVIVASAALIAAGDYVRVNGGSPTQVLWVNGTTILLRDAQTWSNGNNIDEYPISTVSIAGTALSSGTVNGTPTGTLSTTSNYFLRCTNNTTASLIGDSNLFSITIAATGGFTIAPHIVSVTATTATIGYTTSGSLPVASVACKHLSGTPTRTEVVAHTCASGATASATTNKTSNGADTMVLTGLTFPDYDIYAADASTRADMLGTCLAAPSGKQVLNCPNGFTSIATGSTIDHLNAVITPDIVVGDISICDTVTTPGGFPVIASVSGHLRYDLGDASRQYINCTFYRTAAAAFHTDDLDDWFNNQPPIVPSSASFFVAAGTAITPIDLRTFANDPEGDAVTCVGANLHGLTVSSSFLQGTIARGIYTDPEFICTDSTGADSKVW